MFLINIFVLTIKKLEIHFEAIFKMYFKMYFVKRKVV